jgi:hypothetical protein
MKERGNISKGLVVAAGFILAVISGGYFYLARDSAPAESLLLVQSANETGVDGDLLKALRELKVIKFDTTIFKDPIFRSFYDFGTELTPQPRGRPNPFAPVTNYSSAPTFSTSTTSTP